MTYILRQYQIRAVNSAIDFFLNKKEKRNMMLIAPTGAGKSLIISNIALGLEEPTLILQPSLELLKQNYEKFISYGYEASIYSASAGIKEIGDVTFATIGSIYKKPEDFSGFKYVIIDECHKLSPKEDGMYVQLFNTLNIKVLGLTATPFRLKSYSFPEPHSKINFLNRMRPKFFHEVIHVTQIKEMVDNKWWSPLIYEQVDFDQSNLKVNSTGANYTDQSINLSLQKNDIKRKVVEQALKLKEEGRKQVIIYVPSIEQAESIAKRLKVDCISSNTHQKERELILERFKTQKTWAILNVSVLSIGYDNQKIDGIIDCSPTMSLAMYYQRLGRGVRIDMSDNPTKTDCKVIDLVGNFERFKKIEDIEIRKILGKWTVMSGQTILSNTALTKESPSTPFDDEIMEFGKFSGDKFKDVPKWYWQFIAKNFKKEAKNEKLFQYIELKEII